MDKFIFIRYSELTTKSKNRNVFTKFLARNIKKQLSKIDCEVVVNYDNIEVFPATQSELQPILDQLKFVIGISWYAVATKTKADKTEIAKAIMSSLPADAKTFRVSAKNKSDLWESTDQLTRFVAGNILDGTDMKVNLSDYDVEVSVKVNNDESIIYAERHKGIEGLPVGSSGKALVFLSGGIDSPVAAYKMMTRGMSVDFITFLNPITGTDKVIEKVTKLAEQVSKFNGVKTRHFIIDFQLVQRHIRDNLKYSEYRTTMLRRSFMQYGEFLAGSYGYKAIITGDAIGQVASQTVEKLAAIDDATEMLVARPLVGMDKNSIIAIAKTIGTYDYSIMPGDDMCSNFSPKSPILLPKLEKVRQLASEIENYKEFFQEVRDDYTKESRIDNV